MIDCNKYRHESRLSEQGNAIVIVLIVLVVAAVGVLAYMSGKVDVLKKPFLEQVASKSQDKDPHQLQGKKENAESQDSNPVLVKFDGEEIRRQDVIASMHNMPPQIQQIPTEQLFPMAVEQIINNRLVDKNAAYANLENNETVKNKLEQAKKQIIRAVFLENTIKDRMTEARLRESYGGYVKGFPSVDEIKVAHILVSDEQKARDVIKELDKGKSFEKLAKDRSEDPSSENGGDLGYFAQSEVVPEFAEAAFSTKVGEYTKTPVKTDFGYHVIKVDDKRKRKPPEFSEAKPYLEQELQRVIFNEVIAEWKADTRIERFDFNGKPLPEQEEPAAGENQPQDSAPQSSENQNGAATETE